MTQQYSCMNSRFLLYCFDIFSTSGLIDSLLELEDGLFQLTPVNLIPIIPHCFQRVHNLFTLTERLSPSYRASVSLSLGFPEDIRF